MEWEKKTVKESRITLGVMLHARPAGLVSRAAKKYSAAIEIVANGKSADGKSIIALMSLGAKNGDEAIVRVDGDGESEALKEITAILTGEKEK